MRKEVELFDVYQETLDKMDGDGGGVVTNYE